MIALALLLLAAPSPMPVNGRLVTGTGLRIRAAPDASAAIVDKVALGAALACLEESKPVTVGDATATFCKMEKGWYFTALTEPLEKDAAAQIDRLIDKRAAELGEFISEERRPDLYAVDALMLRRIDERDGVARLRARLAELQLVAKYPAAFYADPRVARDESQGPRVQNEAFEKLVADAKGTPFHEDAAFALYQHGWGGECEGYAPCVYGRANGTACKFLASFPTGEHAKAAMDDIIGTLTMQADFEERFPPGAPELDVKKEGRGELAKLRACVEGARAKGNSGDATKALALIAAAVKRLE